MDDSGETRSVWMEERVADFEPLSRDVRVDVCVVGAGIAGLTTAYLLAKRGREVLVLEDGRIGGGETGRTTAHLSDALDDGYDLLERVHGRRFARLAAESHGAAIDRIESIVHEERIECDFERLDGFLFLGRADRRATLERELAAARRAGLQVTLTGDSVLKPFDVGPALRFPRQAQFHPLKYLNGLARALTARGARICTRTRVRAVHDGAPCRAETAAGQTVTAGELVVATNSPISDRLAIHTKQAAYRTYAIALELIADGNSGAALWWDTEDPYHYVRVHRDGGGAVLIVGGEDHKTGQAHDAADRFARLEAWTRERFPSTGAVRYRWSGQVVEPVDHLAFIGRDPGARHLFIVTGDSGHGMTHGTIGGLLVSDLICGRENPWTELYSPNRKSAKSVGTYVRENLNVARQLGDHLRAGDVPEVAAIPPGTGAVVRQGTRKIAVYRDQDGTLHARSAVCTHVGCIVRWNELEKTWDCPCHGSRFEVNGEVVCGPAHAPLAAAMIEDEPYGRPRSAPTDASTRRPSGRSESR
jgi:glycine/D-amino acid oxidase-like deaminating enzyme/nitrite reductase/ring-hydroxylating ferredoxin subunit